MSTKRERLVNSLKAMTAADMVAYGLTPDESACAVKLLAAMERATSRVSITKVGAMSVGGTLFSAEVVAAVRARSNIAAIRQFRAETGASLKESKEAVDMLDAHIWPPRAMPGVG
jgi:ribosomal protein L7/L12